MLRARGGPQLLPVATTAMPILANSVEVFSVGSLDSITAIAAATGSTLYATLGYGS